MSFHTFGCSNLINIALCIPIKFAKKLFCFNINNKRLKVSYYYFFAVGCLIAAFAMRLYAYFKYSSCT